MNDWSWVLKTSYNSQILRPAPLQNRFFVTIHGTSLKLSTNVGPIKVNLQICFYLSKPQRSGVFYRSWSKIDLWPVQIFFHYTSRYRTGVCFIWKRTVYPFGWGEGIFLLLLSLIFGDVETSKTLKNHRMFFKQTRSSTGLEPI